MGRPTHLTFLLVAAAVLLLAGCGGADDEVPTTTGAQTETVDGIDPLAGASTAPVTVAATNTATAQSLSCMRLR